MDNGSIVHKIENKSFNFFSVKMKMKFKWENKIFFKKKIKINYQININRFFYLLLE